MIVTMKDVAKEAGVSQAAVSLVLNKKDAKMRLSEKTRENILQAAERLGYTRNALATAIKTGKSKIIAVICLLQNRHVSGILGGLNDSLLKEGYLTKLLNIHYETDEEMESFVRTCIEQRVAGVVCISVKPHHLKIICAKLDQVGIPLVGIDIHSNQENMVIVNSADEEGMAAMVRHVIKEGHRRIGFLGAYDPWFPEQELDSTVTRRRGYSKAMREAGLDVPEDAVCITSPMYKIPEDEMKKLERFYETYHPSAVVCFSDYMAMNVLQWAYKRKIHVPEDLTVCGFSGLMESNITSPALTTVRQPFNEMGGCAGEKIIALATHKKCDSQVLPDELVLRDSDGPVTQKMKDER